MTHYDKRAAELQVIYIVKICSDVMFTYFLNSKLDTFLRKLTLISANMQLIYSGCVNGYGSGCANG